MKKLVLAVALLFAGPAFAADPILGLWKTIPDDNGYYGHIQIAPCGDKICGTLIASFTAADNKPYASANVGKKLMWDMVSEGDGNYGSGKVWSPDRDKTYKGKLVLSSGELDVKGCVAFICRSGGIWYRVK
ncbi:MAG: DUF2147 domain-containing protein [Rhodobacter sp.]|jgi:uncharacterized protein (DUF2147 family)|nr:DUF2147 domain-containing protein [Rhodobacter sp.]